MRCRPLVVVIAVAALAFGAAACGINDGDETAGLRSGSDPTTTSAPDLAAPAGPADEGTDDEGTSPSEDDSGSSDEGTDPGDDPLGDDGSSGSDGGSGSGDGGSAGGDFCSLAEGSPDPTDPAAADEYFERMHDAAPEELKDDIEIVVDWYRGEGAGGTDSIDDMPDDVLAALLAIGQYSVTNCG